MAIPMLTDWCLRSDPMMCARPQLGSLVLFDLRLRHRGGTNVSPEPRPLLYISYVKDWYHDKMNFKRPHTASYSGLGSVARKLYARLDTLQHARERDEATGVHGHGYGRGRGDGDGDGDGVCGVPGGCGATPHTLAVDNTLHM